MAKDKKSFILYADLINTVNHLSNEQSGELFKHILSYVNDENPKNDNPIIKIAFEPIKQQLKRDLRKFESVKDKRSKAGKRSAELRLLKKNQQNSTNSTSVKSVQQTSTNSTVNDNDNDNVNDNDNKLFKERIKRDSYYLEQLAMTKRTKVKYLILFIDEFDVGYSKEKYNNFDEYKRHFFNWLNKQDINSWNDPTENIVF